MGNNRSRIIPINDECPICYETNSNSIILNCGHNFDYVCLQTTFFEYFLNNKKPLCPLCRQLITPKTLKLIFKKIYIWDINPTDFFNKNTINLKFRPYISKIEKVIYNNDISCYLPCFKLDNIDVPHFMHLDNIEFIHETFNNDLQRLYHMKIDCLLNNKKNYWYKFIKKNKLKDYIYNSSNFNEDYKHTITLYIKNINKVITYNERYGTINRGLYIYDQPCTILFRTYLVKIFNYVYFINELYSICYRN